MLKLLLSFNNRRTIVYGMKHDIINYRQLQILKFWIRTSENLDHPLHVVIEKKNTVNGVETITNNILSFVVLRPSLCARAPGLMFIHLPSRASFSEIRSFFRPLANKALTPYKRIVYYLRRRSLSEYRDNKRTSPLVIHCRVRLFNNPEFIAEAGRLEFDIGARW